MKKKGLRNKSSKRRPYPVFSKSSIAAMLQNKIYAGIVTYKGIEYPGLHEPLVEMSLFQTVQEVMRSRDQAGERKRKHPHYLKGTLYCGDCGSRLSFLIAKGKYPYFYCLGRHRKNGCSQQYVSVDEVEKAVEKLYEKVQLSPGWVMKLKAECQQELLSRTSSSLLERKSLAKKIDDLTNKRFKLLEAYYAEAITIDLLKLEQEQLVSEIASCEERLKTLDTKLESTERILEIAIELAGKCSEAYMNSRPANRRLFNQAFFEKIYVTDGEIEKVQQTELYQAILSNKGSNKNCLVGTAGLEPATP